MNTANHNAKRNAAEKPIRGQRLLGVAEVCQKLGIAPSTLYDHLRNGPPPSWRGVDVRLIRGKRIGRKRLFLESSVDALIEG